MESPQVYQLISSAEPLQARREWPDIFKSTKGRNRQTKITLPSKDIIQIWWRNQKLYRQAKAEKEHHKLALQQMLKELLQVGTTREAKRKRPTKANPKQLRKSKRNIQINNYLKWKWVKCSNQNTWTG